MAYFAPWTVAVTCKFEFPGDPQLLCVMRKAVEMCSRLSGFSEEQCRSLTLAVDEALSNIIRHSYEGRIGQPIEMTFRRDDTQVEFILTDCGREADLERLKPKPPGELRTGGRGIHFIREIMDQLEYQRLPGQNRLRLVKYRLGSTGS